MTYDLFADSRGLIVSIGESIASEGKGEYLYVEGRVVSTHGTPIPGALIETWETDAHGASNFHLSAGDAIYSPVVIRPSGTKASTIHNMRIARSRTVVAVSALTNREIMDIALSYRFRTLFRET